MKKGVSHSHFNSMQTELKCKRSNSASNFNMSNGNFLKSKASQITIFIIIGIILVVSIATVFYFSSISKKNVLGDVSTSSASEITSQIEEQRDTCLNDKAISAIDAYGLDETNIQNFLSQSLPACIQPIINKYNVVAEITSSTLSVSVKIDEEKIEIVGNYPISVKKEDTRTLDSFSLTLPRTISENIITSPFCQTTEDYYLRSWDDKFEIFVPTGTKAQYKNGTCLNKIEIRIEDPLKTYGNRATSLTSLVYIPLPLGAEFSVNNVGLKQKYTDKDYGDYASDAAARDYYVLPKKELKIQLFVPSNISNYYIYLDNPTGLRNSADVANKLIEAKVDHFYDLSIQHDSFCFVTKEAVIESADRRVNLNIQKNTKATKSDGNCLDFIAIMMGPKKSSVVNFYKYDYNFFPIGAEFEPYILYTYRYTQEQVQDPKFLYGSYNWQNLINDTWQDPRNQTNNSITGLAINNQKSDLKTREIKDLRIAYYDYNDKVYRPWETTVDTVHEKIIAKIKFFSGKETVSTNSASITGLSILNRAPITGLGFFDFIGDLFGGGGGGDDGGVNIPAQGCAGTIDFRYATGKISDVNEPLAQSESGSYGYSVSTDNACMAQAAITITPKTSDGDEAVDFKPPSSTANSPPTAAGEYAITGAVKDKDNLTKEDTLLGGTYYAWLDVLIAAKGVGFVSDSGREITEAEFISVGGNNGSEFTQATCDAKYASEPEKKEVCYKCVELATAEGNPEGKTLEYCTEVLYAEGACEWDATVCGGYTDYCKNAACNKCMEWCSSAAEGFGSTGTTSGGLEHCADVIEHECCAPGQVCLGETVTNGTYAPGNCKEMGGTYNRSTEQYLGYGLVRYWLDLSNAEVVTFADQLAANGLTATYIEYFGMDVHVGRYNIINQPQNGYAKAKFLVETMRARNITTFINYINWNAPDICTNNPFSDTWLQNGLGGLMQQVGTDHVIMQTAVEGGERCTDKFERWNNWMAQNWKGMKSYSLSGGTKTAPSAEWFISPTPGIEGSFATGSIVTTDDGTTLRYFADRDGQGNVNPAKLESYAGGINIPCKSGFIYYDFGYDGKKPDSGAMQALGRVAAKKPKPAPRTAPSITLTNPKEGQLYRTSSIPIEGSSDQTDIIKASYTINGGGEVSFTLPHNIVAVEGENRLKVCATNRAELTGCTTVTFNVNTSTEGFIAPGITIINPKSEDYTLDINSKKILFNVTSNQIVTTWKYSLNGGEKNNSFINPSQIVVNNGENNLIIYGTNANGTGSASIRFNIIFVNPAYLPKITIEYPTQGFAYTSSSIFIRTVSNQTINSWKYSLNGGEENICSFCGSGDSLEALEGRNNLTVYGTNANGTGSASTYFFVNVTSA